MTDGLAFVVCGKQAEDNFSQATRALEVAGNDYPIQKIGMDYGAVNKTASRYAKTMLLHCIDYDQMIYLDADTRARENVKPLFDILSDGWDVAICPSNNQSDDVFWHVDEAEKQSTLEQIGMVPLQLQCGVMAVAKNERTKQLFECWNCEWSRWSGEDQAAFIRALYGAPVRVWLLGYPWNGGAAIGHNFGAMR